MGKYEDNLREIGDNRVINNPLLVVPKLTHLVIHATNQAFIRISTPPTRTTNKLII